MFCSDMQLNHYVPTEFCDLISIVSVAYYIMKNEVPSTIYGQEKMKQNPKGTIFSPDEFKNFRLKYSRRFEKDFCSKDNPFHLLCSNIFSKRDYL